MAGTIDIAAPYGGDISLTATGDLALVVDTPYASPATEQRMVRIIMTSPILTDQDGTPLGRPDDLFNPTLGAGLPALVGQDDTSDVEAALIARVLASCAADPGISSSPPPAVTISMDTNGTMTVAVSGQTITGQPFAVPSFPISTV
jgi:hypothetical protein